VNKDTAKKAFLGIGWSFPPAVDASGEIDMVDYEEDVHQAIHVILGTSPGERVMRPDFGAGLKDLVFEPVNTTTIALVKQRVEQALVSWEPRIDLEDVEVTTDSTLRNRLLISIDYRVRRTNSFYNLVYPFYLAEGQPS
jgi:phage baseplate assembly protein W